MTVVTNSLKEKGYLLVEKGKLVIREGQLNQLRERYQDVDIPS